MSRSWTRRIACGCVGVAALALLGTMAAATLWLFQPPPARFRSLGLQIRLPRQGAHLAADQTQAVLLKASGASDFSRFELWVDGELAAVQATGQEALAAAAQLPWRPESAGAHVLIGRVFDRGGAMGRSRPVVVQAFARPVEETYLLPAVLEPGQTIDDLAAAAGVSREAVADANPGLSNAPGAGSVINVPVPADAIPEGATAEDGPPVPEGGEQAAPAPEPPAGFPGVVDLQVAPELACENRLSWTGGEGASSFTVLTFGLGDSDFRVLAELDSDTHAYVDIVPLPASYTYVVRASNETGVTESNLVAHEVSVECEGYEVLPDEELTTAEFEALELITEAPFDRLYCYLGLGASRYIRIPASEDEFLTSPDGLVWDIDRYASGIQRLVFHRDPADTHTASIECWGWQGASLNFLGAAQAGWDRGAQAFETPGFRLPFTLDALDGSLPLVPRSIDYSVPSPYDLAIPHNDVDCLAHILWFSGEEIEGGERNFMRWICQDLTEDTLQWEWSPSEEVTLSDLSGYRIFVNRDYARDPEEDDPALAGWEKLGEIGSAVKAYPIPRPPCQTTYGYKVQAFIEAIPLPHDPAGFREPPPIPELPERASEPSRTFTLTGGECPAPSVLVEIALERVTVHNTWDECVDIDFECNDVPLEAYGEGTWYRQDAEGQVTEIASMSFWNERSYCGGGLDACLLTHEDGTVRPHDSFLPGMELIDTCTPESGCTGYGRDHHRFQAWLEEGDTVSFNFTWWDHDDLSGDDIWCGTSEDAGFLRGVVAGPGMTSFFFGPFSWETWASFDHRHADHPWDNSAFPHQDAECEIDISVTALEVEEAP
jgi:hypothetical protein